jgi:hypothetical protein
MPCQAWLSGGRAIILKSLSTLDYDCHYNFTRVDADDPGRQAGLRRDTDFTGRQDGRFGEKLPYVYRILLLPIFVS